MQTRGHRSRWAEQARGPPGAGGSSGVSCGGGCWGSGEGNSSLRCGGSCEGSGRGLTRCLSGNEQYGQADQTNPQPLPGGRHLRQQQSSADGAQGRAGRIEGERPAGTQPPQGRQVKAVA